MKKALMVTIILVTSLLCAEPVLNLKQIEAEMKTVKDEARFMELLKLIGETQPKTEEDIVVLSRLMDRFPDKGSKAVLTIKDPNLAKYIIKECKKKIEKCERFMKKYPSEEVREKLPRDEIRPIQNMLKNVRMLMWELGELNNKEAVPFLRQYLKTDTSPDDDDSFYGTLRSFASEAIDKIDEEIPLPELVKKLDAPDITSDDKAKIIKQISLSKDPEKKKVLKELASEHKDKDVRFRCAAALGGLIGPEEKTK